MSEEKVSGTVTGGTFSWIFIGATGVAGRDGDVEGGDVDGGDVDGGDVDGGDVDGRDEVGHEEAGGHASSMKNFLQLSRHDFSGFAVVTMSEVDAWLYHAARSPATS